MAPLRITLKQSLNRNLQLHETFLGRRGNLELAVSVDEDESGVANDVLVEVGHARTRGQQRIANWHALYELALQIWVFAGEAEDHEALVAVLAVDLVELGHLFAAGLAPRGPDVH